MQTGSKTRLAARRSRYHVLVAQGLIAPNLALRRLSLEIPHPTMFKRMKPIVERLLNCRIYRSTIPRGTDLSSDIKRDFDLDTFLTVFDVGANIGQSAHLYNDLFPRAHIYCFEPAAAAFSELEKSTASLSRVTRLKLALGRDDGAVDMFVNQDSRINSIRTRRDSDIVEKVAQTTLDAYAAAKSISKIDFLKIDTEGYELEVLRGGLGMITRNAIGFVQTEVAPNNSSGYFASLEEIQRFLESHGYELYGIYDQTPHWTGRRSILYFNAVFIAPQFLQTPGFVETMLASSRESQSH